MVRSIPAIALAGAALLSTSGAQAQAFDARRCSAIRNVEVPYDIVRDGQAIVFTRGRDTITVSGQSIVAGTARLDDPALAGAYHASLRGFMASSRRVPLLSARFGRATATGRSSAETPGFLGALRDMCQSLFEVSEAQARVKQSFPQFVAPIRITLAE